jgi:predicted kinase
VLIVMSGLPGAGKSTLAQELARLLPAPVLSVDPVEAAMWRAGIDREQPTGLAAYVVVEALADELVGLGQRVIVDAVNDAPRARAQWLGVARRHGAVIRYVEVVCSDRALHRQRLERRRRFIEGFVEPTWDAVEARRANFQGWHDERLVLDSASPLSGNVKTAMSYIAGT